MNPTPLNYGLQGRRNVALVPSPNANSWHLPSALFPPAVCPPELFWVADSQPTFLDVVGSGPSSGPVCPSRAA